MNNFDVNAAAHAVLKEVETKKATVDGPVAQHNPHERYLILLGFVTAISASPLNPVMTISGYPGSLKPL